MSISTLLEIQTATEALPPEQKVELFRFLADHLHSAWISSEKLRQKSHIVRLGDDVLLESPQGAPPMTPENIRRMLEDWP